VNDEELLTVGQITTKPNTLPNTFSVFSLFAQREVSVKDDAGRGPPSWMGAQAAKRCQDEKLLSFD